MIFGLINIVSDNKFEATFFLPTLIDILFFGNPAS